MEVSTTVAEIDDARDLFLLAKVRLLDVNDWHHLFPGNYNIALTDRRGGPLRRSARVGDMIRISSRNLTGNDSEMWIGIEKIQYDFFPDILSESISMLLQTAYSPSGNGTGEQKEETIIIKREGTTLTAHCNAGNELPATDDENPNAHLNRDTELHPVLSIPQGDLRELLAGLVAINSGE